MPFSKIWDIYTCFSNAFCTFFPNVSSVDLFWIVVFLLRFAIQWKVFRTQECEKINIAEFRIFRTILCLQKRIHATRRQNERKWTHHYCHHINCTKNSSNIGRDESTRTQARVDTVSIWRECVMLCFARSQRLNQITLRILNK